ncbi:MAG: (Fe-S)-binding protein [Pygmaiobacter massiliensis]|nr:(Fe-S)-binding protein [Pygmaiobacter massiliensis]
MAIPSIAVKEIDLDRCYFNPGCAASLYKPQLPQLMLKLLWQHFGPVQLHSICCHHNPNLPKGSTIINNCAGCDRRFRSLYPGIRTISYWEVLDSLPDLSLPDYSGLTVSVQDSCSYRQKPQVHRAVRSLLRKMQIEIVESAFSGEHSICCGDNFYPYLPAEQVANLQKRRADQMPCDDVVVYCVSCVRSMTVGGKRAHYLPDLLFQKQTWPIRASLADYHGLLQRYIDSH